MGSGHLTYIPLWPRLLLVAMVVGALELVAHARVALDRRPRDIDERLAALADAQRALAVAQCLGRVAERLERRAQPIDKEVVEREGHLRMS